MYDFAEGFGLEAGGRFGLAALLRGVLPHFMEDWPYRFTRDGDTVLVEALGEVKARPVGILSDEIGNPLPYLVSEHRRGTDTDARSEASKVAVVFTVHLPKPLGLSKREAELNRRLLHGEVFVRDEREDVVTDERLGNGCECDIVKVHSSLLKGSPKA